MGEVSIAIVKKDYLRISALLEKVDAELYENLEQEIERALIIENDETPKDLVVMESNVTVKILEEDKEMSLKLVYPNDADSAASKISILAPLGQAIIGLRVGQEMSWKFPDGKSKTLKIIKVDN